MTLCIGGELVVSDRFFWPFGRFHVRSFGLGSVIQQVCRPMERAEAGENR